MNKLSLTLMLLACLAVSLLRGQMTPDVSPAARIEQTIGLTRVTIDYARPHVKGRQIFGELIPYGQVWRTGANEATRITFNESVVIGGQGIAPGAYSLYTIPGPETWTWILNRDTSLWGDRGYDPSRDVVRVTALPERLPERIESMELRWMNLRNASAELVLEWEYTRVRLPVNVLTDEQVTANIFRTLNDQPTGTDYYNAARYYLENGLDLDQAYAWIQKRLEMEGDQFGILRYKALIERQLGMDEAARTTMEHSLQLARMAGNEHYVRMNLRSLTDWAERKAPLSAETILERSIRYHDPRGVWAAQAHDLRLYESRLDGGYRITELEIDLPNDRFLLRQQRDQDLIGYQLSGDECILTLNGTTGFSQEEADRLRLNCDRAFTIRNYYTYLWGLPMKLRDPGTRIDTTAHIRDFFGQQLFEVRVTYEGEVGQDTWYFYFHPETYALSGYRFYHDESKNDGEYILLSGEMETGGLRLPAKRDWYRHDNRLFLGSDVLLPQIKSN